MNYNLYFGSGMVTMICDFVNQISNFYCSNEEQLAFPTKLRGALLIGADAFQADR